MRILIVSSSSPGLVLDARLLDIALRHHAETMGVALDVQQLRLPWQFYYRDTPVRLDQLKITERPDAIVFLENIVESDPPIDPAIPRILVPNLEWTTPRTERLLETIDQVWHKSRFSQDRLAARMPKAQHHHLGFTSIDPGVRVRDYRRFAHFRGKSITRHSREILAVWGRNPHFPELKYQFYQEGPDTFEFGEWLSWKNVSVRAGKLDDNAYFQVLSAHGVHLCTSGTEGFGHYINEARAMAAVPVVLDAAPMNELVDSDCGVLLQPSGERLARLGTFYTLSEAELERGVGAILALSASDLEALGHNARRRFLDERDGFVRRIGPLFETLARLAA